MKHTCSSMTYNVGCRICLRDKREKENRDEFLKYIESKSSWDIEDDWVVV
jgi:hypothetical protein